MEVHVANATSFEAAVQNPDAQRFCTIELKEEYVDYRGKKKPLVIAWHTGKPTPTQNGRLVKFTLYPEPKRNTMRVSLERAQSMFGLFTFPHLMEEEFDERRRDQMQESFNRERDRAIMTWGEYPRGQATERGNGGDIIGPARIPPVILTVEEVDGTKWEPIDLRAVYELGEYHDTDTRREYQKQMDPSNRTDRVSELEGAVDLLSKQNASLQAMVQGLIAGQTQTEKSLVNAITTAIKHANPEKSAVAAEEKT